MEYTCHRCGTVLEEGTVFCSNCGAPQIRVSAPGEQFSPPASPAFEPGTPDGLNPPAVPLEGPPRVNWGRAFIPALAGGLLMLIFTYLVPLIRIPGQGLMVCLGMLIGGGAAVAYYRIREGLPAVPAGIGARIGALAGLLGFALNGVVIAAGYLAQRAAGTEGELMEAFRREIEEQAAASGDPNAQAVLERLTTPEGLAMIIAFTAILSIFAFIVFGMVGGVIGASLSSRRKS